MATTIKTISNNAIDRMTMDQIGMVHPFGELMEYITSVEPYLSMMFLAMRIALNKQQKYV